MGNRESRLIDGQIVIKQNVDVDRTVAVVTVLGLPVHVFLAAEIALNLLRRLQHLSGRERGEEPVFRFEATGLGLYHRRLEDDLSYPLAYQNDGLPDMLFPVAQITAQPQIHLMSHQSSSNRSASP